MPTPARLFVDTNILLDVLLQRDPFCEPAQHLWSRAERRQVNAAVAAISLTNVFFIIRKLGSTDKAYAAVAAIAQAFHLIDVTQTMVRRAIRARTADLEDAIQYACAVRFRARMIVSRDAKGFPTGTRPVVDAAQCLALL